MYFSSALPPLSRRSTPRARRRPRRRTPSAPRPRSGSCSRPAPSRTRSRRTASTSTPAASACRSRDGCAAARSPSSSFQRPVNAPRRLRRRARRHRSCRGDDGVPKRRGCRRSSPTRTTCRGARGDGRGRQARRPPTRLLEKPAGAAAAITARGELGKRSGSHVRAAAGAVRSKAVAGPKIWLLEAELSPGRTGGAVRSIRYTK